jgi:hypothetical protein
MMINERKERRLIGTALRKNSLIYQLLLWL